MCKYPIRYVGDEQVQGFQKVKKILCRLSLIILVIDQEEMNFVVQKSLSPPQGRSKMGLCIQDNKKRRNQMEKNSKAQDVINDTKFINRIITSVQDGTDSTVSRIKQPCIGVEFF